MHEPWIDDRFASLASGENPTLILKMKSGYAVLGDYQMLPGYCVLLGLPRAESLNELSPARRAQFLNDMALVGDAVNEVCDPLRLNYAIMMNYDHYLHAHIQARYAWEPDEYRKGPAWNYPGERLYDDAYFCLEEKFVALRKELQEALERRLEAIRYWEDEPACP